jgi:hypothetical protein
MDAATICAVGESKTRQMPGYGEFGELFGPTRSASPVGEHVEIATAFRENRVIFDGPLAQLVEQRTFNPLVAGSNPARPTRKSNN